MTDSLRDTIARWVDLEGSTRPAALMRLGLGLIVWIRFGDTLAPFEAAHLVLGVHGAIVLLFATLVVIGLLTRVALAGLALSLAFGYFVLGGGYGVAGWYHHHVYLLVSAAFLLALTPCGRSYSVDRLLALRAGHAAEERGPLWGQALIGLQLSAIYFWAAVDKTDLAFLSGERLEQTFVWVYSGRVLEAWLIWQPFLALASVGVVVLEYVLAVAIHVRRWQPVALPVGFGLHAAFYLFLPVNTYSVTMMLLYLALLDPQAVHRFIDRMQGHAPAVHRP
ncbi:MAG: HTTM domain-containing protein [Paracoccaceae bacterium]